MKPGQRWAVPVGHTTLLQPLVCSPLRNTRLFGLLLKIWIVLSPTVFAWFLFNHHWPCNHVKLIFRSCPGFLESLSILTVKFNNRCCLWRRHTFGLKKIFTLQEVRNERNCRVKWLLKATAWEKLLFRVSGLGLNKTLLFLHASSCYDLKTGPKEKKLTSHIFAVKRGIDVWIFCSEVFNFTDLPWRCTFIFWYGQTASVLSPMSLSEATTSVSRLPSTCKLMAPVLLKGQKRKRKRLCADESDVVDTLLAADNFGCILEKKTDNRAQLD